MALGAWLLLLLACIAVITRTPLRTDMGAFLPRAAPLAQQVLTDQVNKGAASHLVLVAVKGAPVAVLAAVSQAMATTLRQQPAFIDVLNGDDKSFAGVQDFVWRNRYLFSPDVTAARFTVAGLHDALVNDLGLLGSDLGALIQQSLPGDPTGEMTALLPQLGNGNAPRISDNVWVAPDGASALLLVHTKAPGFDIDAQQRDLALIETAFNAARNRVPGATAARLLESGPGVFAVHSRDITKRDVTRLSILASAGAIGLLAFAYRSPRVLLLGILPVASGALAAIAAVSLAFGFVHGVTLGFGVTLIGESIDYAIYLFTQTTRGDQAYDTLARIWPTLRLGALTSIVGFSAMLFSNFVGFKQLGLFSIAGLVVAAGTTRFVLPHLVPQSFFGEGAGLLARPLLAVMRHRRRLLPFVGLAVLAGGLALLSHRGGFWDENLAALSPIPAADQQLDQTLRHDLGVPDLRYFVVFQADDEQQALQQSEALAVTLGRLVVSGRLGGFDVPSAILPSERTQQTRQAALPDARTVSARFAQAEAGLPFRAAMFAPFLQDVAAAKTAPLITPANLPPALALRLGSMLVASGGKWDVLVPLRDVADPAAVAASIAQAGPRGAALVDLNQASGRLLRSFQREAVLLAVTGSLAIFAVLCLGLRSVARAVRVAAPLAASVIVTAALLTSGGAKVSIFEVVGFLLIVAVGSNYCLFCERTEPNPQMRERAVASIVLANLCTVSAYGLMSLSSIPVLHDIGKTVAIGTFLSLVFAALLTRGVEGQRATEQGGVAA
jgi:predicted exporter